MGLDFPIPKKKPSYRQSQIYYLKEKLYSSVSEAYT